MKSSGSSDVHPTSPSCLVTIGLRYLKKSFLQAQGLHSIWLTWKQMCFHRADWAFIAACGKLGFTASVWLKKGFLRTREALDVTFFASCSQNVYIRKTKCLA